MAEGNKPYNILVVREYTDKKSGEVKTRYHEAGVAFKTKNGDGFSCEVADGLALTGRFVILPRTERSTGSDDDASSYE